jgi:preprotein translocase subunit SecD
MALSRARAFTDATAAIVGGAISIRIDGRLECRPKITAPIEGRIAVVSGSPKGWTEEQARDLVSILRTQVLPVTVTIVSAETLR